MKAIRQASLRLYGGADIQENDAILIGGAEVQLQPGEIQIGKFRIDEIYNQLVALQARVVELETILLYAPGGSGMLAAKEHFESLQQTPSQTPK